MLLARLVIFFKLLVCAYVLFLAVISFLALKTAPKTRKLIFLVIGAITPFVAISSFFMSFFRRRAMPPCDDRFTAIEEQIESKRVEIFGGSRLEPSFATRWQMAYHLSLRKTIQNTLNTTEKIVSGKAVAHHS